MDNRQIGAILLERGLVRQADLDQALAFQSEVGGLIGQALLRVGALSEDDLLGALSHQLGMPVLADAEFPNDAAAIGSAADTLGLPARWFASHRAACWWSENPSTSELHLVALNPMKLELREALDSALATLVQDDPRFSTGVRLKAFLASNAVLDQLVSRLGGAGREDGDPQADFDTQRLREMAEEAPVIEYVNRLFISSLRDGASDIHIEPYEHVFKVRLRVDGILKVEDTQPKGKFSAVASRIKLLSGMDISEQRLPQDGRQTIRFVGETLDLRVSSLPGSWGESLVIRLLRKEQSLPDLDGLGMIGRARTEFTKLVRHPNGIMLITGPTGSGKSTTLYRCLEEVNDGVRKIITIEDPVEYHMNGITQIQVKPDIGYTFARGLRAILRQDPDVIMVGEIRDGETAAIAAQAALTGHLVLSTLHTNSALAAVERLLDLGLEPFLITSAVRGLAAQRLVRRLCSCAAAASAHSSEFLVREVTAQSGILFQPLDDAPQWREPRGCPSCGQTGYRGRLALYEVAHMDEQLREAIVGKASQTELLRLARQQGFITLLEDGLLKARAGLTGIDEVLRVVGESSEVAAV